MVRLSVLLTVFLGNTDIFRPVYASPNDVVHHSFPKITTDCRNQQCHLGSFIADLVAISTEADFAVLALSQLNFDAAGVEKNVSVQSNYDLTQRRLTSMLDLGSGDANDVQVRAYNLSGNDTTTLLEAATRAVGTQEAP